MSDNLTISFTDTLVVVTCWCGINHAIPADLDAYQRRQHDNGVTQTGIYCPLGHTHIRAGKGKAERLQRDLDRAEQRSRERLASLESERRRHSATKGQLTKTKKRVAKGVCPCCNRTFVQLGRHMATKHPDYVEQ